MDDEIKKIRESIKNKRNNFGYYHQDLKNTNPKIYNYINKVLIVIVLTLITLITLNSNSKFRQGFYNNVFDKHLSFAKFNELYQSKFGSPIPFKNLFKDKTTMVFNEKIKYLESNKYKDGVKMVVEDNYLVPILGDGIVIFVGDKEEYKNTIIIQQSDGVDIWYSNIGNANVKLYDYVNKGSLLGETIDNNLYLVFKKDGKVLDYKKYI